MQVETDMATAREIQSMALTVVHNLALYKGTPSTNACQRNNSLDILMTMIDFPDISRQVALTLLCFADEPSNIPVIEASLENIILLVIREGPCTRILLKLLSKLSPESSTSSDVKSQKLEQQTNVPLLFPA